VIGTLLEITQPMEETKLSIKLSLIGKKGKTNERTKK
jgi:hypothetical protein